MSTPLSDLMPEADPPNETTMEIIRGMKAMESEPVNLDERDDIDRPLMQDAEFQYYETDEPPEASRTATPVKRAAQPEKPSSNQTAQSVTARIFSELKQPLMLLALYMLFGLASVDSILTRFVPRVTSSLGSLNYFGILLKGILLTIVFYLANKVLK